MKASEVLRARPGGLRHWYQVVARSRVCHFHLLRRAIRSSSFFRGGCERGACWVGCAGSLLWCDPISFLRWSLVGESGGGGGTGWCCLSPPFQFPSPRGVPRHAEEQLLSPVDISLLVATTSVSISCLNMLEIALHLFGTSLCYRSEHACLTFALLFGL